MEIAELAFKVKVGLHIGKEEPSGESISAEFKRMQLIDTKHSLHNARIVVGSFLAIYDKFVKDPRSTIVARSSKSNGEENFLFDNFYKPEAIPHALAKGNERQLIPVLDYCNHYLERKYIPNGPKIITKLLLETKTHTHDAELGMVSFFLLKLSLVQYILTNFPKAMPAIKAVFCILNDYDCNVPADSTFFGAERLGRALETKDVAWLQHLSGGNVVMVKLLNAIYECEFAQELNVAWKDVHSLDIPSLLVKCESLQTSMIELEIACSQVCANAGKGDVPCAQPLAAAATTTGDDEEADDTAAPAGSLSVVGSLISDEGALEVQRRVTDVMVARYSFGEASVIASAERIEDLISKHILYNAFNASWPLSHRVFIFDFGHAPEHADGYKSGVISRSCQFLATSRPTASISLLGSGDILCVLDGNSRACRAFAFGRLKKVLKTKKLKFERS